MRGETRKRDEMTQLCIMLIFGVLPLYFNHKHYGLTNKYFANVIQHGLRFEAVSMRKKLTFLGSRSSLRREIEVCYYSDYLDSFFKFV